MTRILVIEDEEAIRDNLLDLLEAENFDVLSADNGLAGVKLAREQVPDLIICDVMMPRLDGYGVLTELRKDSLTATIPFIFLTAKADRSDQRQGMNLGADDYLVKPFNHGDLLEAIAARLTKKTAVNQQSQQEMNELRSSITLALPQELRSPLNGILGYGEYLKASAKDLQPQDIEEAAEAICLSAHRLHQLIKNFLLYADLQLIASDPIRIQEFRFQQTPAARLVIQRAATDIAEEYDRASDLQLELQDARVQIPSTWLEKIVTELVDNAFKYSSQGTPVRVQSALNSKDFSLWVTDWGRGMVSNQIAKIGAYVQFERKQHGQQGAGLGLSIANFMTYLAGGEMRIDSILGKQTTIQVTLPIP